MTNQQSFRNAASQPATLLPSLKLLLHGPRQTKPRGPAHASPRKAAAGHAHVWGRMPRRDLPVCSLTKTTKKGVTRSLMPWTYPLAGWRMAHTNRIRSKIWGGRDTG